jgi:hypothetical protein
MSEAIIAAEYTAKTKALPACLRINRIEGGRRYPMMEILVSGKAQAREFAKKHGAKPWNF